MQRRRQSPRTLPAHRHRDAGARIVILSQGCFKRGVRPKCGVQLDENCGVQVAFLLLREIGKIIKIIASRPRPMSDFKAKMHQKPVSAEAPPQTPLVGNVQRSPRPPSWI